MEQLTRKKDFLANNFFIKGGLKFFRLPFFILKLDISCILI